MGGELLYGVGELGLFFGAAALLILSSEVGFRYGRRCSERTPPELHSHVATIEGAMLGLLALLLGFAFSMAMSRYDTRKHVVLEEVNDLETTYLRSQLLPGKYSAEIGSLLEKYVDNRIEFFQAGLDMERLQKSQSEMIDLQSQLWAKSMAAAHENSDEVTTGYFIETLNELIDDSTKREMAMLNHVPESILFLLLLVACCSIAITGYSAGLKRKRLKAVRLVLIILIAATLVAIVDLDRPRRGLIRVSEAGLIELKGTLQKFRTATDAELSRRLP